MTSNFLSLYVPIADRWYVWDNTGESGQMVAQYDETSMDTLERVLVMNPPSIVKEKPVTAEVARAMQAWRQAYQDVCEENKRWGLPMVTRHLETQPPAAKKARRKRVG
ncbi:MAG: hypothetical protein JWO94_156 [Verrucomicrobiaceae bacterium]|nr:hypothetical protein [Verrucomicrobiaceae bacterium]